MSNESKRCADVADIKVSMFAAVFSVTPRTVTIGAVIAEIRGDTHRPRILKLRELHAKWKDVCPALDSKKSPEALAYDAYKKGLPAFCVSGTAIDRRTPLDHSGLLQIDIDHCAEHLLDDLLPELKEDCHVAFGFVSPGGDGLKLGLHIDSDRHEESFRAAETYFRKRYGVEIDPAVKDRLRLCFVSHDPDAWLRQDGEPLPIPEEAPKMPRSGEVFAMVLPSQAVTISESARAIFTRIEPTRSLFWRGGALVECVEAEGITSLSPVKPDGFRSRVERVGPLLAWRADRNGKPTLSPAIMSVDLAKAIMATVEAREILPPIASVLRCPFMIETSAGEVAVLGQGYHAENGGTFVVQGGIPPQVPIAEAVTSLHWLIEEVDFQSPGDKSRALAAFITPALRMPGFLTKPIPIDVAEADQSQSGKGYRHTLVSTLFNEHPYMITVRVGGVGSFDESLSSALVAGRPFICLDNLRGNLNSQTLESLLTSPGSFSARIPNFGEVLIDPKRFILQLSSNGMQSTIDLANRSSICRIRKRPGFSYRDTLGELQARQPYFLGCVFSVIAEWIASGKPRTKDTRHDFGEWAQPLDWICREILGCAPLMDGHKAAQQRVANPGLSWLRLVALAVESDGRLGEPLVASALVETSSNHGLEIPGEPKSDDESKKQVGKICAKIFKDSEAVEIDGFKVTRAIEEIVRDDGRGSKESKRYVFAKA